MFITFFKHAFICLIRSSVKAWSTGRGNIEEIIILMPVFFFFFFFFFFFLTVAIKLAKSDIIPSKPVGLPILPIVMQLPMLFFPT